MTLEQLGVKCLAQGHIGVSQWIRTYVSHTNGMCPPRLRLNGLINLHE